MRRFALVRRRRQKLSVQADVAAPEGIRDVYRPLPSEIRWVKLRMERFGVSDGWMTYRKGFSPGSVRRHTPATKQWDRNAVARYLENSSITLLERVRRHATERPPSHRQVRRTGGLQLA